MSVTARYSNLLVEEGYANLALARERRVRARELLAQVRKLAEEVAAEEAVSEEPGFGADDLLDFPQVQLMITNQMRKQLAELGWSPEDIKGMKPQEAKDIISEKFTKQQKEESDKKREGLLDDYEEKVLKELEKAKKVLSLLEKKHQATQDQVDRLYEKVSELESESDGSELAHRRLAKLEKFREQQEKALTNLEEQIRAQNKLIQAIVNQEDSLIDDLQDVNDTSIATPGPQDDEMVQALIQDRMKILDEIADLRDQIWKKDKKYQQLMEMLHKHSLRQESALKLPNLFQFNELEDEAEAIAREVEKAEKDLQAAIRAVMKKENTLKNKRVEDYQREIEEAYEDLPEFAQDMEALREESKKDIAEEDPGQEAASKTQFYKDKAEAISGFVRKYEPQFRDFVINFIGPDIPSDPQIEKSLRLTNQAIIKRALEMQKLAARYKRNDMQRSAILLPAVLYELLAKNMEAVLSDEQERSARALYNDLLSSGLTKEAASFRDVWEKTKQVGKGIGQGLGKAYEKGKELSEQASEALDQRRFQQQDTKPRREFKRKQEEARKHLQQLVRAEKEVKLRLQEAEKILNEASQEDTPDAQEIARIRSAIKELTLQLHDIGEQKDVINQGLQHKPIPGVMRGQEQAARGNKSDYQHAVSLMEEAKPEMIEFFALIPDDAQLEQELLRQSDRIAENVNKLVQIAFKEKARFPNLPPTIQAYGHMFLSIDDALDRALRSNEGIK